MKVDLNQQFEERYLLVLSDEERLYESIIGITKEFTEGKIPMDLYVKSLDIANGTVQEIQSMRTNLHRMIKQIRYHLFKMKEFIEINYEDGMDFIVVPNQVYEDQYKAFLNRSHYFLKEWNQYEKEHGLCLPEMKSETRSFELIYKMINLISDEYHGQKMAGADLTHVYMLTHEVHGMLTRARDLAVSMQPRIVADCYYMKHYLGGRSYPHFGSFVNQEFEFKQARANGYPDFEYVREPGFTNRGVMEQKRHHDLVPESQRHQLMTGDIGQSQSSQFNETKYFKSRLFEAGLGIRTYQPTERHPLQTTGQMNSASGNISSHPHFHPEAFGEKPSKTTPPGPKLERPNVRGGVYPGTISEQPTIENAAKRMVRSGSGQPVYPGRPELRQEPSEETTRKS